MVYFSNREMKILRLLTEKDEGVTLDELIRVLEVSKRTVYRELSMLEETVKSFNLIVEKEGKLYQLRGQEEDLNALHEELKQPLAIEWVDVEKRQVAILAMIALQTEASYTQTSLAETFDVSATTIQQDLTYLNETLSKYTIEIKRTEERTFYLSGSEVYIRLYLSQVLSNEINAFDFFQLVEDTEEKAIETESQYLLGQLDSDILRMVSQTLEGRQPDIVRQMTDEILINFITLMTISFMRLLNDKRISHLYLVDQDELFPYMQQVLSIVKAFDSKYKLLLDTTELSFFAVQLRGINARKNHSIFQQSYDMEFGYNIKYLIQLVSKEFQFDFNGDNVLYHDLINHLGAALKRLEWDLPNIENEVLKKLKEQYPELYNIVEEKLIEVFSPTIFTEEEIGYVVTHFASSFEKHGYRHDLKVLVVCTSGIGTSKILKTRLERSIPDIEDIEVVRAVDLNKIAIEQFEVIFSTIPLPGFSYDYTLINPILEDKEIETIKRQLSKYPKMEKIVQEPAQTNTESLSFDIVKQLVKVTDAIIEDFEVIFLEDMFESISSYIEVVFHENSQLQSKLKQRLKNSPLAIPKTGIMLLHTTDQSFDRPILKLHHLKQPIQTIGMDRQPTEVDRIIIMLGPELMDELTTEFLGAISSSIIENEKYTKIYQTGTSEELKEFIGFLSVDILQNKLR